MCITTAERMQQPYAMKSRLLSKPFPCLVWSESGTKANGTRKRSWIGPCWNTVAQKKIRDIGAVGRVKWNPFANNPSLGVSFFWIWPWIASNKQLLYLKSVTPYTWAEKFESFERINSIRETNGNFDSCNSKRLVPSRLHELHDKISVCFTWLSVRNFRIFLLM